MDEFLMAITAGLCVPPDEAVASRPDSIQSSLPVQDLARDDGTLLWEKDPVGPPAGLTDVELKVWHVLTNYRSRQKCLERYAWFKIAANLTPIEWDALWVVNYNRDAVIAALRHQRGTEEAWGVSGVV